MTQSEEYSVEVTRLIEQAVAGDREVEDRLIDLLMGELRQQAERLLPDEQGTLVATQLVNDVWMNIFHTTKPEFANRHAFRAYVGKAMRNLLIDHVRQKRALKNGGTFQQQPLASIDQLLHAFEMPDQIDIWELNLQLEKLKEENLRQFQTVELHFFGGLSLKEIAEYHDISASSAERDWALARAKLKIRLEPK